MNRRERVREQMSEWLRGLPAWGRALLFRGRAIATVWSNPVVVRDVRVRMRGSRSYFHLALYLGLLGLLAVLGYVEATSGGHYDPQTGSVVRTASAADIQRQLQDLYGFIFYTLASLVCFIAPALTAASLTTERQRLTLDLLVTTPLTSSELLVGKLVSSLAFLALLLVLSLPASALCVVLGGATMGDVFRVYTLLLIDGLVLSAIGLYYSSTSKNSMNAIVSTYISVGVMLWISAAAIPIALFGRMGGGGGAGMGNAAIAIGALNPFFAVTAAGGNFDLAGLSIPMWLVTALFAFLAIRLIVTGATYRMGSYGTDALGSLRRQVLFLTGVGAFLIGYGVTYGYGSTGRMMAGPIGAIGSVLAQFEYTMIAATVFAGLFLPNLFTPESPEDALPGQPVDGTYDVRRAFRPFHAGSLPYFHLWLGTMVAALLLGAAFNGAAASNVTLRVLLTAYYISGLGFLAWCLARRMATFVAGVASARAITFGAQVTIIAMPILLMVFSKQMDNMPDSFWAPFWVFYPVMKPDPKEAAGALLLTGTLCYLFGILVFPFWKKLVPAGIRYWGVQAEG